MQQPEAVLLVGMLSDYGRTAEEAMTFGRSDSYEAVAAGYTFRLAHKNLYTALHELTTKHRIEVSGLRIEADHEGLLHFRQWRTRPFSPRKAVESWN